MTPLKIGIIGSGNMAFQLSRALLEKKQYVEIYRRSDRLEDYFNGLDGLKQISSPEDWTFEADFIILAISDDQISKMAKSIKFPSNAIALHCSGSTSIKAVENLKHYGVLYPLQSMVPQRMLNFDSIPIFVEGNSIENTTRIVELAKILSRDVHVLGSDQRKRLHLAAVVCNNFINHLLSEVKDYLDDDELSAKLDPLIHETIQRISLGRPDTFQTGPAKRNDIKVIDEHMRMLAEKESLSDIYKVMSEAIRKRYQS